MQSSGLCRANLWSSPLSNAEPRDPLGIIMSRQQRQLLGGIDPEIGFGALEARMPEPQRDLADVAGCRERVHGAAMSKHVRRHPLSQQRGPLLGSGRDMLRQTKGEAVAAHPFAVAVEEQLWGGGVWTSHQPSSQSRLGLSP